MLRDNLEKKGYKVYKDVHNITNKYDIIFFIDSLYYFEDPLYILEKCKSLLKEDGFLILRITNRNWIARIFRLLGRKNLDILGDATYSYSLKSITKLLDKVGFSIENVILFERGKIMPIKKKIAYYLGIILSYVMIKKFIFSPGLIIIASKIKRRKR